MLAPLLEQLAKGIETIGAPYFWALGFQPFVVAAFAIVMVSLICGSVGPLVVGNRMAFFSDALAHCAFAGVALALLYVLVTAIVNPAAVDQVIRVVMLIFGLLVAFLIAFVKERTSLSSDTVIGVFFAFALGLGAMLMKAVAGRRFFNIDNFLFGDPASATFADVEWLIWLGVVTAGILAFIYNWLLISSFNPSLAKSRGVPVRACTYAFIMMLGLIIFTSIQIVGVLLINGLLVVPAAAAANVSRNMRQMFWLTLLISVASGIVGHVLSWVLWLPDPADPRRHIQFGVSGLILVLAVLVFFLSMIVKAVRR